MAAREPARLSASSGSENDQAAGRKVGLGVVDGRGAQHLLHQNARNATSSAASRSKPRWRAIAPHSIALSSEPLGLARRGRLKRDGGRVGELDDQRAPAELAR